jgi:putative PIN family toxin of toxin-antitoxin system
VEVVLDANVAVSAGISPTGSPADVIRAWRARAFIWISSPALLAELNRTMRSPRVRRYLAWSEADLDEFLATVERDVVFVEPSAEIADGSRDPDDNRVLEAAVEADADFVVSGDSDLLELDSYRGIAIVTPARFVALLAEAPG